MVLYLETSPFIFLYFSPSFLGSWHCGLDDHSLVSWRVLVPRVPQAYHSPQFFKQSYSNLSGLLLINGWDVLPLGPVLFYGFASSVPHSPQIYIFPKNIQRKIFCKILNMLVFYLLIRGNYICFIVNFHNVYNASPNYQFVQLIP